MNRSGAPQRNDPRSAPPASLRGRRLAGLRAAWLAVAAITLGLDALAVPYYYARDRNACAGQECLSSTGLTTEQFRELHEMGLSNGFFAAYDTVAQFMVVLVFAAVAAVIFWRRSEDPMVLFASFTLLVFGGAAFTSDLLQVLVTPHPGLRLPTELLDFIGQVCFITFFYVFPDGRFTPRWTRWLVLVAALLWASSIFLPVTVPGIIAGPSFFGLLGSMVAVQVYHYRRVSSPVQRQQTRWVVSGVVAALVGFSAMLWLGNIVSTVGQAGPLVQMGAGALINAFITLIPLSIGVAMVRSRLYEIDVVINRTLVYGTLTASLALVYLGSVVGLQRLLYPVVGAGNQLAIVASTLLIAALFNPLKRGLQGFIDRRFYRKKYDAAKTLEAFGERLQKETDLDALGAHLVGVVQETMQPKHVSLWLREPDERERR